MDLPHPSAEVTVDATVVRRLLEAQHPGLLTGEPVLVDEGWDNFIFRVGAHGVRMPRRQVAVDLLLHEQRWLPDVASWLPIAVPVPVAVGVPSEIFRWPWSVIPWIEGTTAEGGSLTGVDAEWLAAILRLLHRPAPTDAPTNPYRGVPIQERRTVIEERIDRLGLGHLTSRWEAATTAPPAGTAVWIHGDLHPRNIVQREGAMVGLIDWGDMTGGDPATDLACAWTLFDAERRAVFRGAYAPTDAEWARATGWAIHFGSAMVDSGEPAHVRIGQTILDRLSV